MIVFTVSFIAFSSAFLVTNAIKVKSIVYDDIPTTFNNYKSVIEPPDETLTPIYEFAKDFIDATVPVNFNILLDDKNSEWQDIFEEYSGAVAYVIVMLIIGFVIPIVGIIFAISRCCCNACGAKARERHPKQGRASIIIAGGFSIIFAAFLLFAIAVGMRSNVVIEKGTENVFDKVIVTMRDTIKYSDNTYVQIQHLMELNYQQFSAGLTNDLNAINENLAAQINPNDLIKIKDGFATLKESILSLENTKNDAATIKSGEIGMKALKRTTEDLANSCKSHSTRGIAEICAKIENDVRNWTIPSFNFPELGEIIVKMKTIEFGMYDVIMDTMIGFRKVLNDLLKSVAYQAKEKTNEAGVEITKHLVDSKVQTDQVKQWMTSRIQDVNNIRGYYDDWGKLRYGLTFLLPTFLIAMIVLIGLGFLTGMCCRTSSYKEKGCANASVAGYFFMTIVALIFIFALVFAVAICGYYAIGLLGQRYICNTFDTMDNVKGLKYLDDTLDIQQYFGDGVTLQHLLKTCNANKPLYEVIILKNVFDLDEIVNYLDEFQIKEELIKLTVIIDEQIEAFHGNFSTAFIDILKRFQLDDVDVELYNDQLEKMQSLVNLLTEVQKLDPTIPDLDETIGDYNTFIVNFENLARDFEDFKTKIKMGGSETYQERLDEFKTFLEAYHLSITNGNFGKWGKDLTDISINTVQTYLNRIKDKMLDTVGLCEPASVAIKATLNQVCGNIFNPMNAFWVANFFALIAFIPLLGVSIFLVSYFRQYVMTDDDRYRKKNYYIYNPPGARGSTIEAYDVRDHHRPPAHPHTDRTAPTTTAPAHPRSLPTTPLPPVPPNHYYNPNSGHIAATPIYPSANSTSLGAQGRNLRRQQEYPYAMKGTSLADSDVHINRTDKYTRF